MMCCVALLRACETSTHPPTPPPATSPLFLYFDVIVVAAVEVIVIVVGVFRVVVSEKGRRVGKGGGRGDEDGFAGPPRGSTYRMQNLAKM